MEIRPSFVEYISTASKVQKIRERILPRCAVPSVLILVFTSIAGEIHTLVSVRLEKVRHSARRTDTPPSVANK